MDIHWTTDLSVGVETIDAQHRELFSRLNRLFNACQSGDCTREVEPVLQFLLTYVQEHFAEEEQLMQEADYPELEEHRQQHAEFRRLIDDFERRIRTEENVLGIAREFNRILIDWLTEHVCTVDRALGRYLLDQTIY